MSWLIFYESGTGNRVIHELIEGTGITIEKTGVRQSTISATGGGGSAAPNLFVNGEGRFFQAGDPASGVSFVDGGYDSEDGWYGLREGSGPTCQRGTGGDGTEYEEVLTAGSAIIRYGRGQIVPHGRGGEGVRGVRGEVADGVPRARHLLGAGTPPGRRPVLRDVS